MKSVIALFICALELAVAHFLDLENEHFMLVWQVELMLLALLGVLSDGGKRDRAVLSVFTIWFAWVAATDWWPEYIDPLFVQYEASFFSALVLWALVRPYFFPSDARNDSTICIMFYKGDRAPILSSIASLFGLPFASVAIVAGDVSLRASKNGSMVATGARAFGTADFVCIDTGVKITPGVLDAMHKCAGTPTKSFGLFRTKCVSNLEPALKEIGYEPKTIFHKIPSIFYFQCVKQAHG